MDRCPAAMRSRRRLREQRQRSPDSESGSLPSFFCAKEIRAIRVEMTKTDPFIWLRCVAQASRLRVLAVDDNGVTS
jgi:hypothetical protein